MNPIDYVIVGREVDEARRFLQPNGSISDTASPAAVPLTVEYIGETMVDLSKRGKAGVTPADLADIEERFRQALRVKELGPDRLTAAEVERILKETTVSIIFEDREIVDRGDRNTRILVVPSDRTLELAAEQFQESAATGFSPPLSYDLDRRLRLANLKEEIMAMVARFGDRSPPGWTDDLQAALNDHIRAEIDDVIIIKDADGKPADSVLNDIMNSPLRAFHRSVGIYATNMCR